MRDGARILTPDGHGVVEDLKPDTLVRSASGQSVRVVSVTRRESSGASVDTIRIIAGAFGRSQPDRDVDLAPDTLVLVDKAMAVALHLVNGATIKPHQVGDATPGWDVSIEAPDGTVEPYRPLFGADGFVHADLEIPRNVERMPLPAATKRRLLDVASRLGFSLTDDPRLHIEVDGVAIPARSARGNRYIFAVPERASALRLVSRVWVPAEVLPESDDDRQLGVCIRRLVLDGHELDLTTLNTGWDKIEDHGTVVVRWTKGSAVVPLAKPRFLDVELYGFRRYWVEGNAEPAAAP